jgi:polysaccharide export outer membrane protein
MDGKISLPLIGDISAANKTPLEVQKEISEKYSKYIKDPVVTVEVRKGNVKIQELKKAITTAARGQSKLIPVRPDGMITLPLIGDVQAAGLTIPEIRYEVNRRYATLVRNLDTTVILKEIKSNQVYVLGEVYNPGSFTTPYSITSMQAIAMAGGLKTDANDSSIIVLRDVGLPVPKGVKIDLDQIFSLEKSDLAEEWEARRKKLEEKLEKEGITDASQIRQAYAGLGDWTFVHNDVVLRRNDIVYVPRSFIGSVDRFIDQWFTRGLYSVFPSDSTMDFILDTWDVIHIDEQRSYRITD